MRSGATPSSRALFEEARLVCRRYRPVSLLADLEEYVHDHRAHGALTGDATEPAWNGYLLTVACSCGVVFERWVTLGDAMVALFLGPLPKSAETRRRGQDRPRRP